MRQFEKETGKKAFHKIQNTPFVDQTQEFIDWKKNQHANNNEIEVKESKKYKNKIKKPLDEIELNALQKLANIIEYRFKDGEDFLQMDDQPTVFVKDKHVIEMCINSFNFINKEKKCENIFKEISKFKHLERLILYDNNIREVPESISELTSLKNLILNGNIIENIPESIANLRELKYLDLVCNPLEKLPEILLKNDHLYIETTHSFLSKDY